MRNSNQSDVNYKICGRCVMDTSDPDIVFDTHGNCNHCGRYYDRYNSEVFSEKSDNDLARVVNTIKNAGKDKKYDCVAGVSGGVDSTFILYKLKNLGLRPLAVHFDNGWNSQEAQDNINNVVSTLQVDLQTHTLNKETFSDLQSSFLKASVPNCEIPTDHAITATLVKTADSIGTPYVINGSNLATEGILPISWVYYSHDLFHIKSIYKLFGNGYSIADFPQISLLDFSRRIMTGNYRMVNLLNYIDFDKNNAIDILKKDVGWQSYGGKHFESIYTRWYQGYYLVKKFGIDKRRAHFSALICSNQMVRSQALTELASDPYENGNLNDDMSAVLDRLGISHNEFEEIVMRANRKHTDYPNRRWLIEGSSSLRGFIRRKAKQI